MDAIKARIIRMFSYTAADPKNGLEFRMIERSEDLAITLQQYEAIVTLIGLPQVDA